MKEIILGRNGNSNGKKILDPTVSRKHCKVTDNGDGTYTIENLSAAGTFVEGRAIIRSIAQPHAHIRLGQSFSATLAELIGLQSQPISAGQETRGFDTETFNISHLCEIWETFNRTNIAKSDEQRRINLIRTGLGIFTACATPSIFFFGPIGYVLTAIGLLGNIYSLAGIKNAETAKDKMRRMDEFEDAWVCPNPDCRRTLPAKNYKMLVRNFQSCPYCKCKYIEQ